MMRDPGNEAAETSVGGVGVVGGRGGKILGKMENSVLIGHTYVRSCLERVN